MEKEGFFLKRELNFRKSILIYNKNASSFLQRMYEGLYTGTGWMVGWVSMENTCNNTTMK